jgi:hypothetical protein
MGQQLILSVWERERESERESELIFRNNYYDQYQLLLYVQNENTLNREQRIVYDSVKLSIYLLTIMKEKYYF